MSFEVVPIPEFVKDLKWLVKKYRSLKAEMDALGDELAEHPHMGTPLPLVAIATRSAWPSSRRVQESRAERA